MRLAIYSAVSVALSSAAIYHAYSIHKQFYPTCIYLSRNSASFMVYQSLMNVLLLAILFMGKLLQQIFIGPLRVIEVEHLYERAWFSVSETCLAMTIFRNDFDTQFVIYFSMLLLFKCFHWLASDRVDFMEQTPVLPRYFYPRIVSLLFFLALVDLFFLYDSYQTVIKSGPSISILFCFEYSILLSVCLLTTCRFILHAIDHRYPEHNWENKSTYLFYLDLIFDFVKLCCYMTFFVAVLQEYGLPIHIIRDLYITTRSFFTRIRDMIQYRRVTMNMNERYPTVTQQELDQLSDKTCIICRDDMAVADNPKRLMCGHVFHFRCLRNWLERQQTCPTCRRNILEDSPIINPQPAPGAPNLDPLIPAPAPDLQPQQQRIDNQLQDRSIETNQSNNNTNTIPYTPVMRLIPLFTASQAQNNLQETPVSVTGIPGNLHTLSELELKRLEESSADGLRARLRLLESIRLKTDLMSTDILSQLSLLEKANAEERQNEQQQ